eukprot:jgi/Orpsp1_1/1190289/evm.model.d7180000078031.1
MDDIEIIDDTREKIKNLIKKQEINQFFNYVKENDILLKTLNKRNFDILIFSIDHDAPLQIIKFIINQIQYKSFNYSIIKYDFHNFHNILCTPLYSAILKNNFEIANFLIDKKADVNYLMPDILNFYYRFNLLTYRNFKYMLIHGLKIEYISLNFIYKLLKEDQTIFLKIIYDHYVFSNDTILSLLQSYKSQIPVTNAKLNKILTREKNIIKINETMYNYATDNNNIEMVQLLLENDGDSDNEILKKISKYK